MPYKRYFYSGTVRIGNVDVFVSATAEGYYKRGDYAGEGIEPPDYDFNITDIDYQGAVKAGTTDEFVEITPELRDKVEYALYNDCEFIEDED